MQIIVKPSFSGKVHHLAPYSITSVTLTPHRIVPLTARTQSHHAIYRWLIWDSGLIAEIEVKEESLRLYHSVPELTKT